MKFGRRKGISYILEVAMMTLVVVALATVVLTWGLGQVSNSRIALTGAVNDRINRMQETINVEDVQMLTSTTMRVYVRNTGSIQVLIDAVYINNVNTPVSGTCPAGSFQAGTASVTGGTKIASVTLSTPEPSFQAGTWTPTASPTTGYLVSASAGWPASFSSYTVSSSTAFTITFSANALGGGLTANWFTNYPATPGCSAASSLVKLSLAINAIGALDVSVPASVSSCSGGPVCLGTTYTVTASTNRGTTVTGSFTV